MSTPPIPHTTGKPERNVVAVAWGDELAQQADDAGDDHTDDVHRRPFTRWDGLIPWHCRSTRLAEGAILDGNHGRQV